MSRTGRTACGTAFGAVREVPGAPVADVFISYKSERRGAARHLSKILALNGFPSWYDYGLIPGEDFERRLLTELAAAKVVVVLWCELAVGSEWVLREAREAQARGAFVPCWIQKASLPAEFAGADTVDLTRWSGAPGDAALYRLLAEIGRRLGRPPEPKFEALHELHLDWESLGSPTLASFALGPAPAAQQRPPSREPTAGSQAERRSPSPAPVVRAEGPRPPPAREPNPAPSRPSPPETARPGEGWTVPGVELPLVWVPSGEFWMGAQKTNERAPGFDPEAEDDESPVRRVRITGGFWLGQHPVTNRDYRWFVDAKAHRAPRSFGRSQFDAPDQPVTGVDWHAATAYCAWLSTRFAPGWRAALPTEAQWEWAARGGDGRRYPWRMGGPDATRAAYLLKALPAVGGRSAGVGPFGAHDQAGLAWEWCEDEYAPYPAVSGVVDDPCRPSGTASASLRVIRGGSWYDEARRLRAASRSFGRSGYQFDFLSFRVCVFREPVGRP